MQSLTAPAVGLSCSKSKIGNKLTASFVLGTAHTYLCIFMKHLLTLCFLLLIGVVNAQNAYKITGTVLEEGSNAPLELAAVVLRSADSTYVADAIADKNGRFLLSKIASGKYFIEVNFLSFVKFYSSWIEVSSDKDIGTVKITKSANYVKEVNVEAIKNAVEFKPGKTVYTVARDATNTGLNGLEVLRKIPGVFIDNNDNITVRGKSGIRIYIDDRPSAMAAESAADAIRFFPAGSIESIEIITNPSARYDAAGAAAIINVKLKKEKKMGSNGNISAGVGSRYEFSGINKFTATANGNIRRNKSNFFYNASGRDFGTSFYNENNRFDTSGGFLRNSSNGNNHTSMGFIRTGIDFFLNDRNTLGISYSLSGNQNVSNSKGSSKNNFQSLFYPETSSQTESNSKFKSQSVNVNYLYKTKHAGEEISFDVTQSTFSRKGLDSLNSTLLLITPLSQYQYTRTNGTIVTNTAQSDYSRTLKGSAKIEAGIKNSYTGHKSIFDMLNLKGQEWNLDSLRSNRFDYYENISAAYTQYSNKYHKWEYQLGLRAEYTKVNSNLNDVKQEYLNLFPTVQLGKKFENEQEFSFSFSRRIDRPGFNQLTNAVNYTDRYVGNRGNPKLRPEISNSCSFDYQKGGFESEKDLKLNAVGASAYGSYDKNSVTYLVVIDTNNVGYTTFANIPHSYSFGGDVFAQFSYARIYNGTINFSSSYNYMSETSKGNIYNVYMMNSFKFLKKHSIDVSGYYFSRFLTPQGYVKGNYQVSAAYKYVFHKTNMSLTVNLNDIFKTGRMQYFVNSTGYRLNGIFQFETRMLFVTYTWKFSSGWQGDGKRRTKKNANDSRMDMNNNGGGFGNGK